jgi:hypothetical protein
VDRGIDGLIDKNIQTEYSITREPVTELVEAGT